WWGWCSCGSLLADEDLAQADVGGDHDVRGAHTEGLGGADVAAIGAIAVERVAHLADVTRADRAAHLNRQVGRYEDLHLADSEAGIDLRGGAGVVGKVAQGQLGPA